MNAIKFANIISLGQMSFDQHYNFIKEGIITFEEQIKRLEEIKNEKEKENKEIDYENYDIIIDDMKNFDNIDITVKCNDNSNTDNDIHFMKDNNKFSFLNSNQKYKFKVEKIKETNNINNNNNNININNIENNKNEEKINVGYKKRLLGRKRKTIPNTVKHHLIMDLIYSIDDFIYNKRDFKLNGYDSFFQDIQLKISKNKLNTSGLNVSKIFFNIYIIILYIIFRQC